MEKTVPNMARNSLSLEDFDIYHQVRFEGTRRKTLIEPLISQSFKDPEERRKAIQLRTHEAKVPSKALEQWIKDYRAKGEAGLQPENWAELWETHTESEKKLVLQRYSDLGEIADAVIVRVQDIRDLACKTRWSLEKAMDLLRRYRSSGFMGLSPKRSHDAQKKPPKKIVDIGSLTHEDLVYIFQRLKLLGDLADKEHITNKEAIDQGKQVGKSSRTIRYIWTAFREGGLAALRKDERSDKGGSHSISEQVVELIIGVRLSLYCPSIQKIYDEVAKRAGIINELPPSKRKVREVIRKIPEDLLLIVDRRYDEFRSKFRFTHTLIIGKSKIILQLDATQIDILAFDKRNIEIRTKSGEIRPWLVTVIEANSRVLLAAIFSYDEPNRYMVATALYEAVKTTEKKWYGGHPDEIWVDRGKPFTAYIIQEIALEINAVFNKLKPRQPQVKGVVEAFFNTLNERLWRDLEGYVDSDPQKRNPNAHAKYTIDELESKFWDFINDKYHKEQHSDTGEIPLEYWKNYMYIDPVPDEILSILLMEREYRSWHKGYVHCRGEKYWSKDLYRCPGKNKLMVKHGFSYGPPEYVDVFSFEGEYICTAYPDNSSLVPDVTPDDIAEGQRAQREEIDETITSERKSLTEFDKEHGLKLTDGDGSSQPAIPPDSSNRPTSLEGHKNPPKNKREQKSSKSSEGGDLMSLLAEKRRQAGGKPNA